MKILLKNGKCYFIKEITKEEAINISSKKKTHDISIEIKDKRPKSYEQIKLFWSFLDEFLTYYVKRKVGKEEKNKLKLALYEEYRIEKDINISLSKSSITACRLFIDWVIEKFSKDYNYISKNIELQNDFTESYVYSTINALKCAICGKQGKIIGEKKVICLCKNHENIKENELKEKYYLYKIKKEKDE